MSEQGDQVEVRLSKASELSGAMGVELYPARTGPVVPIRSIVEEGETGEDRHAAGRIRARREHGKSIFMDLSGDGSQIQVYLRADNLPEHLWKVAGLLDLGDIVRVGGPVFRTRMGELTIDVRDLQLLSKSIRPTPVVKVDSEGRAWDALADTELMYRHRCIDLLVNPDGRRRALTRARIVTALRSYLDSAGFIEVETPILQPIYGGASAEPFSTEYRHLGETFYLRIATELYLKRLLVGGIERVYEIGKDFRNEGIDRTHSPEFTQLEIYEAYGDYGTMMGRFEDMVLAAADAAGAGRTVVYRGQEISLATPFERLGFVDSLRRCSGEDLISWSPSDLRKLCDRLGIAPGASDRETLIDKLFDYYVTAGLVQPTFVLDYPEFLSPLAKHKPGSPGMTERFEPFIAGMEVGNAFSEQNDPVLQRRILQEQAAMSCIRGGEVDEDFLHALELGMPPAGGLGVGVDRLVMLLTDAASIRDVILFPQLRRLRT